MERAAVLMPDERKTCWGEASWREMGMYSL